jgi:hypothetical protein
MDELTITINTDALKALTINDLEIIGRLQTGDLPLPDMIAFVKKLVLEDIGQYPIGHIKAIVTRVAGEIAEVLKAGN